MVDMQKSWCKDFVGADVWFTKNMIKRRDGLQRAFKLRHVAHLTGCKMFWLAHNSLYLNKVNKVNIHV